MKTDALPPGPAGSVHRTYVEFACVTTHALGLVTVDTVAFGETAPDVIFEPLIVSVLEPLVGKDVALIDVIVGGVYAKYKYDVSIWLPACTSTRLPEPPPLGIVQMMYD